MTRNTFKLSYVVEQFVALKVHDVVFEGKTRRDQKRKILYA